MLKILFLQRAYVVLPPEIQQVIMGGENFSLSWPYHGHNAGIVTGYPPIPSLTPYQGRLQQVTWLL